MQRELVAAFQHECFHVGREDLACGNGQCRMADVDAVEDRRQRLIDGGERVRRSDGAGLAAGRRFGAAEEPVGRVDHAARLVDEHLARRRQVDAAVGAIEQARADLILDDLHLVGQRLLGHVQPLGRAGEIALTRHLEHIAHLAQLRNHTRNLATSAACPASGPSVLDARPGVAETPCMDVAVIGAGRIGGNIAQRLSRAGHAVAVAFSRDQEVLAGLAGEIGARASSPAEAVEVSDVVVLSVPWDAIPDALAQAGPLEGRIVIDTTNQFGLSAGPAPGQTAATFNAARLPGARYTKSFNTLTAAFQRVGDPDLVQWLCGDEVEAKVIVAGLIRDAGYTPSIWVLPRTAH